MKGLIISLKESVAFNAFIEKIMEKTKEWEGILRNSNDVFEIYRAQGALNFAEFVHDLPDLMVLEAEAEEKEQKGLDNEGYEEY